MICKACNDTGFVPTFFRQSGAETLGFIRCTCNAKNRDFPNKYLSVIKNCDKEELIRKVKERKFSEVNFRDE